jgi:hypothetical protein
MRSPQTPAVPAREGAARGRGWRAAATHPWAAAAVLATFWILMAASLRDKSLTYDEVASAAAGYSYWHYGDYRLQPENGQLPQRVAGLPMELSVRPIPAPDAVDWRNAEQWKLGDQWIYRSGEDAASLGAEGRMCCGLFAVALGALVWAWSRRLFGPAGGMLSLLLFVLSPTVLANGALMTSDMAAALFFIASAWGIWGLLSRMTPGRVILSALLVSGLFLSKISALLLVPMALVMVGARLVDGRPLPVSLGKYRRELASRAGQAVAVVAAVIVHAVVVVAVLWASYGFRYSAFSDPDPSAGRFRIPWEYLLAKPDPASTLRGLELTDSQRQAAQAVLASSGTDGAVWSNRSLDAVQVIRRDILDSRQRGRLDAALATPSRVPWERFVEYAREHHLLPEAWIYGFTDVYRRSQVRPAFLNGEFRLRGWPWFFPYTFLVKTPLAALGLMVLAFAAIDWCGRRERSSPPTSSWTRLYATVPLWAFLIVYWAAAITSHLNIGHRHLLPVYAPMFILCGVLARWIEPAFPARRFARAGRIGLAVLLVLLAADTLRFFPDYLAYFNGLVRPRQAYRHLVDSSLDWGQDLPAVQKYLESGAAGGQAAYLSYFGTASPDYYGISARPLFSVVGLDWLRRPDWKNEIMTSDAAATAVPVLREEWPDHDIIGLNRVGDSVVATLLRKPESLRLGAGTYLISASMLQPVNFELAGPWGRWNERYEGIYQRLRAVVKPLEDNDPALRRQALVQHSSAEWEIALRRYEEYRFGRLTAFLRGREPDDEINFTVLVYHLADADLKLALEGPPPELGPDDATLEKQKLPPAF